MLTFEEFDDTGDERGSSFSLDEPLSKFLGTTKGVHIATILPGHSRGNHFHNDKREIIFVMPGSEWTLYWDNPDDLAVKSKKFPRFKSVLIKVPPRFSHALLNTGNTPITIIVLSDHIYTPDFPDTVVRRVSS